MGVLGPLIPDEGPRAHRAWRRLRGIAVEVILFAALTLLSPLLLLATVMVDVVLWLARRKPWMAIRLLATGKQNRSGEFRISPRSTPTHPPSNKARVCGPSPT